MDNILIYSCLALVIMNAFLWIWILFRKESETKIISIIANAIKRGDKSFHIHFGANYLTLYNKHIGLLCDYLKINIVKINAQPEKYVVVKEGKKT